MLAILDIKEGIDSTPANVVSIVNEPIANNVHNCVPIWA